MVRKPLTAQQEILSRSQNYFYLTYYQANEQCSQATGIVEVLLDCNLSPHPDNSPRSVGPNAPIVKFMQLEQRNCLQTFQGILIFLSALAARTKLVRILLSFFPRFPLLAWLYFIQGKNTDQLVLHAIFTLFPFQAGTIVFWHNLRSM